MKFQAELVNFKVQLENRVLCKIFSSRQNSKASSTKRDQLKNLKMHSSDKLLTFRTNFM